MKIVVSYDIEARFIGTTELHDSNELARFIMWINDHGVRLIDVEIEENKEYN